MSNTMKSPLMKNTDENNSQDETIGVKVKSSENRSKFVRNASRNSTSTQTSVNYNILSPLSVHNSFLNSTNIQSAILCRICYNGDGKEPLLQPCNCSGTMGLIHRSCLEKWLSQCNKNQCEICGFDYNVQRTVRPFNQWLFRPIATRDTKNLLNDLLCFLILTPLAFISTWYCIGFAFKFTESINKWESSGLVILTTFLVIIYFLWLIFSSRYHYKVFKDWQNKNQIVTLKIEENKVVLTSNFLKLKNTYSGNTLQITNTSIEQESRDNLEQTQDSVNIGLYENSSYQPEAVNVRRPIYKKQSDVKVESCVIEV